jgi:hypothetical protein
MRGPKRQDADSPASRRYLERCRRAVCSILHTQSWQPTQVARVLARLPGNAVSRGTGLPYSGPSA